jgi:hypothetical protein
MGRAKTAPVTSNLCRSFETDIGVVMRVLRWTLHEQRRVRSNELREAIASAFGSRR